MRHQDLTINHRLESWQFADAAARNAAGAYVSGDVGRIGYQTDTKEYWRLTATTPTWERIPLGNPAKITIFGSSGTYTPPAGCRAFFVECIAGGGAGGGAPAASSALSLGSGGGAGSVAGLMVNAPLKPSYSFTIGVGGTGVSGAAGNPGTDTTFDSPSICTAKGGSGGVIAGGGTGYGVLGGAGGGGAGGLQTIMNGGAGGSAVRLSASQGWGGDGGGSLYGGFGKGGPAGGNPTTAFAYGCGGGGTASSSTAQTGGAGGGGLMRITEFS